MNSWKKNIIFSFAIIIFTCAQIGLCQSRVNQPVQLLAIEEDNIQLALSKIAYEYKVPIGLEIVQRDIKAPRISIHIKDGTVYDALNAVTEQDSRYEWKLVDGVINVFPKANRDKLLEDLLETRVKEFVIRKGTSRWDIRRIITELPEVKAKLEFANTMPSIAAWTNVDFQEASPGFALELSNVTVQEILNHIVKTGGIKYWIVSRKGENKEFIIINF